MNRIIQELIDHIRKQIPEYTIMSGTRDEILIIAREFKAGDLEILWIGDIDSPNMKVKDKQIYITEEHRRLMEIWRVMEN